MGMSKVGGSGPLVCVGVVAQRTFECDVKGHVHLRHTHMTNQRVVLRVRQRALGAGEADLHRMNDDEFSHVALRDACGSSRRHDVIRGSMASRGSPSIRISLTHVRRFRARLLFIRQQLDVIWSSMVS